MQREIKFRAWDKLRKTMRSHEDINIWDRFMKDDMSNQYAPLMQYTGLKDKKGKEIYEGDIIKFSNHIDEVYEEIGVVDFDLSECGYKATYKTREFNNIMGYYGRTNCIYLINNKEYECEYEVIGNIYENPELLEKVFNRR